MKKRTKILLGCAVVVVVVVLIVVVITVAVFLSSLNFGEMEPMRLVDTTGYSPSGGDGAGGYRVAAEWEPVLGALVAWPLAVPVSLVVEIAGDDTLFLLVGDEVARSEAREALAGWGVDLEDVEFIVAAPGHARPWPRDWGPPARFSTDGGYTLVDPTFDDYPFSKAACDSPLYYQKTWFLSHFTEDDDATRIVADALGYADSQVPVALTGGNALVDGHGTIFSTCTMLNENKRLGITEDVFFSEVGRNLGISRYVVIPNFETFGIQHIDCFLKLLDEERILVARPPEGHSHSERTEAIVRELETLTNVHGRPYEILRIDTPPYWRDFMPAYTNSLILNRKVLVPLFGIPADQQALDTWRRAMPGYEVIGFENDQAGAEGWMWFDALHCRVRAVWDPEGLHLAHRRMDRLVTPADEHPIEVRIEARSRADLIAEELMLSWRLNAQHEWRRVLLVASPDPGTYTASIPGAAAGETVEYFVSAADASGRRESLPRTAPDSFYTFTVGAAAGS
jgi:agmatine/peptidylarginine deiminase